MQRSLYCRNELIYLYYCYYLDDSLNELIYLYWRLDDNLNPSDQIQMTRSTYHNCMFQIFWVFTLVGNILLGRKKFFKNSRGHVSDPEAWPGPSHKSKLESFTTIVNDYKSLTLVEKFSILDIYGGPCYASAMLTIFNSFMMEVSITQKPVH